MGFVEKLKRLNINNKEEIARFKEEVSLEFFKKLINKLKDSGGWENLDKFLEKLKKRPPQTTVNIEPEIKYKKLKFNEFKMPNPRATNIVDYFLFTSDEISAYVKKKVTDFESKKSALGIGVCVKIDKQVTFLIGLQAIYGESDASVGKKIREYAMGEGFLSEFELQDEDDDTLLEKIKDHLKEKLDKISEENKDDGDISGNYKQNRLSAILHALHTKPFLILAGVSGTGKTQIARIIAGMMGKGN